MSKKSTTTKMSPEAALALLQVTEPAPLSPEEIIAQVNAGTLSREDAVRMLSGESAPNVTQATAAKVPHVTTVRDFEMNGSKFQAFTVTHRASGDAYKTPRIAVKCLGGPDGAVASTKLPAGMLAFLASPEFREYAAGEGIAF